MIYEVDGEYYIGEQNENWVLILNHFRDVTVKVYGETALDAMVLAYRICYLLNKYEDEEITIKGES